MQGWHDIHNASPDTFEGSESSKPTTSHLEGYNFEILVVNEPVVNASAFLGGKIVVFTGLMEHFRKDAEIATIIAHEMAHVVARHDAEKATKTVGLKIIERILRMFAKPDRVDTLSSHYLWLPLCRRLEIEADYIGLLLMASAGYDPRVAPRVYMRSWTRRMVTQRGAIFLLIHPEKRERSCWLRRLSWKKLSLCIGIVSQATDTHTSKNCNLLISLKIFY